MGGFYAPPLEANYIDKQPNMLDSVGKVLQLKNMLQKSQQEQALFPGQLQEQQQNIQSGALDLQQKQLLLSNQKIVQNALADPNLADDLKKTKSSPAVVTPSSAAPAPQAAPFPPSQMGTLGGMLGASPIPNGPTTAPTPTAIPNGPTAAPTPTAIPNAPVNSNASVQLHPIAQYLMEKKGLPMFGPGGALEISQTLTKAAQGQAELAKTQGQAGVENLNISKQQHENFDNIAEPVLAEKDPTKQQAALQNLQSEIQQHPDQYPPEALQHLNTMSTIQGLQVAANTSKVKQMLIDDAKNQAETSQKVQAASAPTPQQILNASRTIGTYEGISPAERQGLITELRNAPDVETLQKIQARADSAQASGQMKQASLAQARAMMGNKFGEAGLTANEKIWTDPQRGFAGALAQANQTKASITAGADGNALLTNMVPTMEVLGINHAAGISRISPAEAIAAGTSPEWATRWNAWASKVTTGKLTPELAQQGQQLMDIVTDAAHTRAINSANLIAKGHGLDPSTVPAMNRDGSLTTLDKVKPSSQPAPGGGMVTMKAPNGQTKQVSADQVEHYKSLGAKVVQ